ncbi:hypothetical protein SVOphi44_18 [Psuedomonas phage SVOphi44]
MNVGTVRTNKLNAEQRRHLARREGVSDKVLALLNRAVGLDVIPAAKQVKRERTVEDVGGGLTLVHETIVGLHYPVAGYPEAY